MHRESSTRFKRRVMTFSRQSERGFLVSQISCFWRRPSPLSDLTDDREDNVLRRMRVMRHAHVHRLRAMKSPRELRNSYHLHSEG